MKKIKRHNVIEISDGAPLDWRIPTKEDTNELRSDGQEETSQVKIREREIQAKGMT